MSWDYPLSVNIDGEEFEIENNCDYRVVLDCLDVYEDVDIDLQHQHQLALFIFYKDIILHGKINHLKNFIKSIQNARLHLIGGVIIAVRIAGLIFLVIHI